MKIEEYFCRPCTSLSVRSARSDPVTAARAVAAAVPDPELPMLTVADLGILRDVAAEDGRLVVCGTCRARLVEGEVTMRRNYALEQEELDAGYILTCQSLPASASLIVDYDA